MSTAFLRQAGQVSLCRPARTSRQVLEWSDNRTTCNTHPLECQELVGVGPPSPKPEVHTVCGDKRRRLTRLTRGSETCDTQSMDESLQAQIDAHLSHLDVLIRRGREIRDALVAAPEGASMIGATRAWQEECGATISQLSGGSKAHWLARSFSEAFLVRSAGGGAVEGSPPAEIVSRLLDVLEQAVRSLAKRETSLSPQAPAPRRFDFVHDPELRPVLEQAYSDSRRAIEEGNYELALRTSSGILEAILTDALQHRGRSALAASGAPASEIADWPFETRLAVAERAGLIRGGCARLPAAARSYRDVSDAGGDGPQAVISERDARVTGQVLQVVMRDLNPGR